MTDLRECARRLGHEFRDLSLLDAALTHPSIDRPRGRRGAVPEYERLEFLGDRVLGLAVAEHLYRNFPGEAEGALARRFTALVRREALARIAQRLEIDRILRMSRGEEESGGRENPANLADSCEAVIAALYLDGGFGAASAFIERFWHDLVAEDVSPPKDAKTELQEWAQARGFGLPTYTVVSRNGPDHAPMFTISVMVESAGRGGHEARARGKSKRIAEQAAAKALLDEIGGNAANTAQNTESST